MAADAAGLDAVDRALLDRHARPVQARGGERAGAALQARLGHARGRFRLRPLVGRSAVRMGGKAEAEDREAPVAETEQVPDDALGRGAVVDADEVQRRVVDPGQVGEHGRVDDHGGQLPLARGLEHRIVGRHRVHDQAVHSRVADGQCARGSFLRARDEDEGEHVRVDRLGHSPYELGGPGVLEGGGQGPSEDDADRARAAAAQAAGSRVGSAVAQFRRGAQDPLA